MPFPGIIRRLFANNGAGPKLRKDILPSHADTHAPGGVILLILKPWVV